MSQANEFSQLLSEDQHMDRPRVQMTLAWLMLAVVAVGVLVWLCMVAEYHLSGRAYDDWVDGASCPVSFK